ncbi:hypothetical protein [Nosocomiicoccus sp. HMSC059G07]|nr:hypothetical protein [Nosocomiicoccus sp. HMSC059G07]OFO55291.1 hypothetical protein HMPREF3029_04540 [Nosocomiicoccus sp. HMSC059G07]
MKDFNFEGMDKETRIEIMEALIEQLHEDGAYFTKDELDIEEQEYQIEQDELEHNINEEFEMTDDLNQSLWITPDNQLLSGYSGNGIRSIDHRALLDFYNLDRQDTKSWDKLHEMGYVRVIPETEYALIYENQPLSEEQKELIESYNYKIEPYGVIKDEQELEEEAYYDLLEQYAEEYLIENKDDKEKYITVIGVKNSEVAFTSNLKEFEDEYHDYEVDHYLMLHHNKNVYSIKDRPEYERGIKDNPLSKKYETLLRQTRVGGIRNDELEKQAKQNQQSLE